MSPARVVGRARSDAAAVRRTRDVEGASRSCHGQGSAGRTLFARRSAGSDTGGVESVPFVSLALLFFAITLAFSWTCFYAAARFEGPIRIISLYLGTFAPGIVAIAMSAQEK